jgi:hypothetical protein
MNYGQFIGSDYVKKVVFSKAVLWHTRQLSLREDVVEEIKSRDVKNIIFVDNLKKEKWVFKPAKVYENMVLKRVGQEAQYYFPIDLAKKMKTTEKQVEVKPQLIFDTVNGVCREIYPDEE